MHGGRGKSAKREFAGPRLMRPRTFPFNCVAGRGRRESHPPISPIHADRGSRRGAVKRCPENLRTTPEPVVIEPEKRGSRERRLAGCGWKRVRFALDRGAGLDTLRGGLGCAQRACWGVVQLVARLVLVQDVVGSSPTSPANNPPALDLRSHRLVA